MFNFDECIKKKKIFKANESKHLIKKEFMLAKEDLDVAIEHLNKKRYRLMTIQTYYSMFHSARVLLYSKGYREKSHICLRFAIDEFFVKTNLLDKELLEAFKEAKNLREDADYKGDFNEKSSKLLLDYAKRFLKKAEDFLDIVKKK